MPEIKIKECEGCKTPPIVKTGQDPKDRTRIWFGVVCGCKEGSHSNSRPAAIAKWNKGDVFKKITMEFPATSAAAKKPHNYQKRTWDERKAKQQKKR